MVDFELSPGTQNLKMMVHGAAEGFMRPVSRQYDEDEHAIPWDFINFMWQATQGSDANLAGKKPSKEDGPTSERNLQLVVSIEELSWGDAGIYLSMPGPGLGGAAVAAAGTAEQKTRFLSRFRSGKPKWAAMAITEPGCGSDSSAIQSTAVRDGDHWVLNGTKIFCTAGHKALMESEGFIVVWATVDKAAGRAGIKAFIVEHGTPGITVAKLEHKLGIRASDTAAFILDNCRVPRENLLGSPEIDATKSFAGVMQTFDNTRPLVAGMAVGLTRACLELTERLLREAGVEVDYDKPASTQSAAAAEYLAMEADFEAARLLTLEAAWMADNSKPNSLQASMAKAKAGRTCVDVALRCVRLCGSLGYGEELLLEKWARDAKILDLFEGTQQIQLLIIARQLLGKSSAELK